MPTHIPSSFPDTACVVETASISRRFGAAALVIAAVLFSMLVIDRAAGAQPTIPPGALERGSTADPFGTFIAEASQRFGVPASWICAVMRVESLGDVHALSPKGATGLMQIMPDTWTVLRARYRLGANPYDPRDNILAGAAYLRELHDRYGAPGFLAAYNAGPARSQPASGLHVNDRSTEGAVEDLTALAPQSNGLFVRTSHRNSKP